MTTTGSKSSTAPSWIVVTAMGATTVGVLPLFFVSAFAAQIRGEFGLNQAAFGLLVSCNLVALALSSFLMGRVADRVGAITMIRSGTGTGCIASLVVLIKGDSLVGLAGGLILAGIANGMAQSSASALLKQYVRYGRQGIAFGFLQSSKPLAATTAGLTVPLLALMLIGWRGAFMVAATGALLVLSASRNIARDPQIDSPSFVDQTRRPKLVMLVLAVGIGFGFGNANMFAAFLVDSTVATGLSAPVAGTLLSVVSVLAIATRIGMGIFADKRGGEQLGLVAAMMILGGVGFGLLATHTTVGILVGAAVAAVGAWGYNGLFYLSIVRLNPSSPGAAAGLALSAGSIGGILGPILFGLLATHLSYTVAWLSAVLWTTLGAGSMLFARVLARQPSA